MCEFKRDERTNQAEKHVPSSEEIAAVVWIAMRILRRCLLSSLLLSCEVVWARGATRRCQGTNSAGPPKANTWEQRGLKEFSELLTLSWNSMLENMGSLAKKRRDDCSVSYPRFLFPGQLNAWGHCLTVLWKVQHDLFFSEEIHLCILAPHQIHIHLSTPLIPSSTHRILYQGIEEFKGPHFLYVLGMSNYWEAELSFHHPASPDAKGHKVSLNVVLQT